MSLPQNDNLNTAPKITDPGVPSNLDPTNTQTLEVNNDSDALVSAPTNESVLQGQKDETQTATWIKEDELPDLDDDKPVQKVIIKKEKSKGGISLPHPGCGCKSCSCYGCLVLVALIVTIIAVIYFRPSFIWNPIKRYLNNSYDIQMVEPVSSQLVNDKIESSKEGSFELSEAEFQSLVNQKLNTNDYLVDIEPNYLRLVKDVTEDENEPLWLILEVGQDSQGGLSITKVGFERIDAPDAVESALSDVVFSVVDIEDIKGDENDAIKFMKYFLALEEDKTFASIRLDKDKITFELK